MIFRSMFCLNSHDGVHNPGRVNRAVFESFLSFVLIRVPVFGTINDKNWVTCDVCLNELKLVANKLGNIGRT
jgi:hypothetical protein